MRERPERVKRPGTYVTEWVSRGHFFGPVFSRTALLFSGGYHMERGGMPLHDAVGKIKAQVSSIWAKECNLMTVRVFYLT